MTKFIVLGDTHFGVRNDVTVFHAHYRKFYDFLFDWMDTNGVNKIYQLGDLFDRRKFINFHTLAESKQYFFDRLRDGNIEMITLIGNHDIYWRESLEINSANLLLREYDNITICQHPQTFKEGNTSIDIIPWIAADNQKEVTEFINKSSSDLCFGHFEIAGFAMYKGMESHDGLSVSMFEKYELVCSGHYHTKSHKQNITYVGTPYEMTWQDYNDPKGFHVFDTDTRKLAFIQNPYTTFVRLTYDDTQPQIDLDGYDLRDCFVKLVVVNKTDLYKFDTFVSKLYNKQCFEIKIVEDMSEFSQGEVAEEIDLEDTMDVLSNYIDSIETDADKEKIKTFMKTLYVEAINSEVL